MSDVGKMEYLILVSLSEIEFVNDEMTSDWYRSGYTVHWLEISAMRLKAIHANAFKHHAFKYLLLLCIDIKNGPVVVHDGAFNGFETFRVLNISAQSVWLPAGVMDVIFQSLREVHLNGWPSEINLKEMFGNVRYRIVILLYIRNVVEPQTKFRLLAADNFTSFRTLNYIYFINCGIEVIHERTFDVVGRTLSEIFLMQNRIKTINLEMFRNFFETKFDALMQLKDTVGYLICSCSLVDLDLMMNPFGLFATEIQSYCMTFDEFDEAACAIYRHSNVSKYHAVSERTILRLIGLHMAYTDGLVVIKTNFTSRIRMLLVDLGTMGRGDCVQCISGARYKCLTVNKYTGALDLSVLVEIRDAEFISITAIPILYNFGARPMHSMTISKRAAGEQRHEWLEWIIIALVAMCSIGTGLIFGIAACIYGQCIRAQFKSPATDQGNGHDGDFSFDHCDYYNQIEFNVAQIQMPKDDDYDYYGEQNQRFQKASPNEYMERE